MQDAIQKAADIWKHSRFCVVLTGAGISVPSGIPDFRGPGGLWTKHNPDKVATLQALRSNPRRVWEFLIDAALLFGTAKPNPAHLAVAELGKAGFVKGIITQNIDNLHQEAGSEFVVEFHGNGKRFYCMGCKQDYDPELVKGLTKEELPWTCERCGHIIRPDFVFFGEHIPAKALTESLSLSRNADLAVIIGTSGTVAPANTIPYQIKNNGGKVIEINLHPSAFAGMPDLTINAPAQEIMPEITKILLSS